MLSTNPADKVECACLQIASVLINQIDENMDGEFNDLGNNYIRNNPVGVRGPYDFYTKFCYWVIHVINNDDRVDRHSVEALKSLMKTSESLKRSIIEYSIDLHKGEGHGRNACLKQFTSPVTFKRERANEFRVPTTRTEQLVNNIKLSMLDSADEDTIDIVIMIADSLEVALRNSETIQTIDKVLHDYPLSEDSWRFIKQLPQESNANRLIRWITDLPIFEEHFKIHARF